MKLAKFMALPKFMKRLNFKDKRLWLVVLFIVLLVVLYLLRRSNMNDGFITPPPPPNNVTLTPLNNSIRVVWSAAGTDGGSPVTGFIVEYSLTGNPTPVGSIDITNPSTTSTTITGLTNGTQYSVKVRTRNAVGVSGDSVVPSIRPGLGQIPPNPPYITGSPVGNGQITINWNPATQPADSSAITKYTGYAYGPNGFVKQADAGPNDRNVTITGLTNGISYNLLLRVTNAAGLTAETTPIFGRIPDASIANPLKYTVGNGSITVSWDDPPGNSPVNVYAIRAIEGITYMDGVKSAGTLNGNAKSRSATIRNLKNGVSYSIKVRPVDKNGRELFQYLPLNNIRL